MMDISIYIILRRYFAMNVNESKGFVKQLSKIAIGK